MAAQRKERRFDTQKNIRLYIADIYKEVDEKRKLTDKEINYYKLKLSLLKEIGAIIRTDNDEKLEALENRINELVLNE